MSWGETIFLKKFIQGEKRFVVSDAPIAVLVESPIVLLGRKYFVPKINGIVRIKTTISQSKSYTGNYTLSIYLDDNIIKTVTTGDLFGELTFELYADVEVAKGKRYRATIDRTGGASYTATPIVVCAQVTDANYFETEAI